MKKKLRLISLSTLLVLAMLLCACLETDIPRPASTGNAPPSSVQPSAASAAQSTAQNKGPARYEDEPPAATQGTFLVRNQTGNASLSNLHSSLAGENVWSDDLLSSQIMYTNEEITLYCSGEWTRYDFYFFLTDLGGHMIYDVEVLPGSTVNLVIGQDGPAMQIYREGADGSDYAYYIAQAVVREPENTAITVTLTNHTGGTLTEINLSRDETLWGGNALYEPLAYNASVSYVVSDYDASSLYDIRAIDADGVAHHMWDVQIADQCDLQIALGQSGLGVLVQYYDGSHAYWMADTNPDY